MDNSISFSLSDFIISIALLSIIASSLVYYTRKSGQSFEGYFLAGKNINWQVFGISLFITAFSSELLFGLILFDYLTGLKIRMVFIIIAIIVFILGGYFAKQYARMSIITTAGYFKQKLGSKVKSYFTWLILGTFVFIKAPLILYVYIKIFHLLFNIDMSSYMLFVVLMTGVFTLVGGLRTIMHLQILQAVLLFFTIIYFSAAGWQTFEINYLVLNFLKDIKEYTAAGNTFSPVLALLAFVILSIWYWTGDQCIVQKVSSLKDSHTINKGIVLAFILIIILLPGGFSGNINYESSLIVGSSNTLSRYLNISEKWLLFIGISIFLISSLSNVFQNSALIFTNDIYKPLKKEASERKLVLVGRLSTTIIIVVVILMVPLIKFASLGFFIKLFGIYIMILSPIAALLISSLFVEIKNSRFPFFILIIGNILGLLLVAVSIISDKADAIFLLQWSFFDYSVLLFTVCLCCLIVYRFSRVVRNKLNTISISD